MKRIGFRVGEFRHHTQCRACSSEQLKPFLDFGYVPLAGGFFPKGSTQEKFEQEKLYPLQICFCQECNLVQVNNAISESELYDEYFYFSSSINTLQTHFKNYAEAVLKRQSNQPTVLEIGCNDGVLLKPLKQLGANVIGVDPAKNVVQPLIQDGYKIFNTLFSKESAETVLSECGNVDLITSSHAFAHFDDLQSAMEGIRLLLKKDGIFEFEVHDLAGLVTDMQYDMMYHEHFTYYSLMSVLNLAQAYDMEVFDVETLPVRGGSIRFSLKNQNGNWETTPRVRERLQFEKELGLDRLETFVDFGERVKETRSDLQELLEKLKSEGKTIAGYGASGRGTIISAYCQLDSKFLDYVIDDAPAKQGAFTPGNHLQIVDSSVLTDPTKRPDYVLLFAWVFSDEIAKRNPQYKELGGNFIAPLPKVRIL